MLKDSSQFSGPKKKCCGISQYPKQNVWPSKKHTSSQKRVFMAQLMLSHAFSSRVVPVHFTALCLAKFQRVLHRAFSKRNCYCLVLQCLFGITFCPFPMISNMLFAFLSCCVQLLWLLARFARGQDPCSVNLPPGRVCALSKSPQHN